MTKELKVYFDTKQIGILVYKKGHIYFEYDKEFLTTGIEISPIKLPLQSGVFRCEDNTFDGLWGVFADSLPDGWGRLLMDREFLRRGVKSQDISPLDRLALVGQDSMGALSYEPISAYKSVVDDIILDDLARSSSEILKGSSEEMIDELFALGGSSAGARPKILVQVSDDFATIIDSKKSLEGSFSHYIIKFASRYDSKDIALIEYVYNQMAQKAGLEVPEFHLFEGKEGYYFGAKRFDRLGEKRVHMHSVAGVIHSDFRYPTLDYDDLLKLTLHLSKSVKEQEKLYRLACFNLFAHNRDDHAKNFSYLLDDKHRWVLSPTYDLTYSFGPGGEHSTTYMQEGREPTIEHLVKLAQINGIERYQTIIDEVKEAVIFWRELAKDVGVSKLKIVDIEKSIQNNIR
ncbi:MAG: type II toxin-antitoxin system HipA family toxin [Epsilonproteobacteria bacterium]|nr:type II toxin-antitoxin system HipA family toxin [Campylobacterota bacterium]